MSADSPVWSPTRTPWTRHDALALAVWTAAIAIVFRDAVIFRGALFYFDVTELNYPYRAYLFRELAAGRLSFWLPNLYCGMPLFSESQAGYFHPLKYLLYPWLPTWRAFNLDTVLSVWLAGVGSYGWLRRHVGCLGALTGASIVGLGGYTWAHLIHTSMINALASVPFAVWALESAWDGGRRRAVVLGAFALTFQVFAGHLQDTILTGSALGVYTLIRAFGERTIKARVSVLSSAFLMVTLTGFLAAIQWVPSKELLDRSPRSNGLSHLDLTYGSWHPQLIPALLVHEIYGTRSRDTDWMDGFFPYHEMDSYLGVAGLFLAAIGAKAWRDRWVRSWLILGAVGLLLMLGRFTFLMDYLHKVPILGSSRIPVRFHLWVTLATAALVAVGVDRIARFDVKAVKVSLKPGLGFLSALLLVSIGVLIVTYRPAVIESLRWDQKEHRDKFTWISWEVAIAVSRNATLFLATIVCASQAIRSSTARRRLAWAALLPVFSIADMAMAHGNDIPTVSPAYWTDPPPSALRVKRDPGLIRLFGEGTYSSGEPGHASKPINFMVVRETLAWSLAAAWDLSSIAGETPILSRRRVRFGEWKAPERYHLEGLSHILTFKPEVKRFGPAEHVGATYIHRNAHSLPRARIVGKPIYAKDEREAIQLLKNLGAEATQRIVVETSDHALPTDQTAVGEARITHEIPDRVEVAAVVDSNAGFLLLSDTFDPGWTATVDGAAATILPANCAFRAVYLTKGPHKVVFSYRPVGLVAGGLMSLLGLVVSIAFLIRPGPDSTVLPEHDNLLGPSRFPWMLFAAVLAVILASTVAFESNGRFRVQKRWEKSFYSFTWGAKIEAIKPPPPAME